MRIQNNSNKKKILDKALIIMAIITITMAFLLISTILLKNTEIQIFKQKGDGIKESYSATENNTWDISENGDGSVVATLSDDGTLTISGTGKMKDWENSDSTDWYEVQDKVRSVIIKEGVTNVGNFAFDRCTNLISIEIKNSVTNIGEFAFADCTNLTSIKIMNGVINIKDCAFIGCESLISIEIPNSVTGIGYKVFAHCTSLTSIEIPDSVTSIGDYAFFECTSLTNVEISNSVTSIGCYAFNRCTSLTSINVDEDNKDYMDDNGVLYTKNGSEIIRYPAGKKETIYTILTGTTSIGDFAFEESTELTRIEIPNSVTSIGWYAFERCTSLTSIEIPNSVKDIGYCAFFECTSLTSINIPNGVTRISAYTFMGCTNLTSIEISNGVTNIDGSAFRGCTSLTSIKIPDSVTIIGEYAFYDCTSLTSIKIPNSVTSIAWYAFYGCTNLTNIEISNGVTDIGEGAFQRCTSLTSIKFPNSITSLGKFMFDVCTSLTNIEVDEGNKNYKDDNGVLYTKDGSEIIRFPEGKKETIYTVLTGTTSVGECAFERCTSLTKIVIPDSVKTIDENALYGATSLISIQVDEENKNYMDDNGVLYTKDRCEIIKYPEGKKETIYTILTGTTSIGNNAFRESIGLTSIEIPNSLINIGDHAFRGCTSLKNIVIPNSVTNIGFDVFYECPSLTIYCKSDSYVKQYAINNRVKYVVDDEGPTIISVNGISTEWTNEDVILTINGAQDGGVGLAEKPYSFDGGTTWQTENTKTYTENTDGIVIKVKDKLDNIYIHDAILVLKIDKQVPIITSVTGNPTQWTNKDVTLTISSEDSVAGLAEKPYSFDGGETWQAENTNTYTKNTSGIIIKVKDKAGNVATYNDTVDITKIDKVRPMITGVTGNATEWTDKDVTLKISASDISSGLDAYSFDGGETWQQENTKTYTENTSGIIIKVKDKAGNVATYVDTITIDKINGLDVKLELYEAKQIENHTYITNITPETSIKEFATNIKTNGAIEIYKGTEKITNLDTKIGTGMTVKIILNEKQKEYTVAITGDSNGDGKADIQDIFAINKHRLNKGLLADEYLVAGDANKDGKININDIFQINKYRLGMITEL